MLSARAQRARIDRLNYHLASLAAKKENIEILVTMKRTLIIGNGFDLDAGLHTSYRSFASSDFWPFKGEGMLNQVQTLAYTLNVQSKLQTWFDVEEIMFNYARRDSGAYLTNDKVLPYDKKSYQNLKKYLESYLQHEEENFTPRKDSVAATVLKAATWRQNECKIYSFNYTDLGKISNKLDISKHIKCEYIHGSLAAHDIILGVGDRHDLRKEYYFLYKTMSPHFKSHSIIPDMQESDEVLFFGHSLGYNDYAYFQPFFNSQVSYKNYTPAMRKKIWIFTNNQDSAFEIKRNLRDLTGNDVNLLYSLNDFQIICTDGTMNNEIVTISNSMMC